jgi:hypothetical protein
MVSLFPCSIEEETFSHFFFLSNERVEGNERQMQWRKGRGVNMESVCMLYTVKQIPTLSNEPKCSLINFKLKVYRQTEHRTRRTKHTP